MTGQPFNRAYPGDTEETFAPEGKVYNAMESWREGKREIHHRLETDRLAPTAGPAGRERE